MDDNGPEKEAQREASATRNPEARTQKPKPIIQDS
jgi:hypothetical protein